MAGQRPSDRHAAFALGNGSVDSDGMKLASLLQMALGHTPPPNGTPTLASGICSGKDTACSRTKRTCPAKNIQTHATAAESITHRDACRIDHLLYRVDVIGSISHTPTSPRLTLKPTLHSVPPKMNKLLAVIEPFQPRRSRVTCEDWSVLG